jgi:hypothetical protein
MPGVLPLAFHRQRLHFLVPLETRGRSFELQISLFGGQRDQNEETPELTASEETGDLIRPGGARAMLKRPGTRRVYVSEGK